MTEEAMMVVVPSGEDQTGERSGGNGGGIEQAMTSGSKRPHRRPDMHIDIHHQNRELESHTLLS